MLNAKAYAGLWEYNLGGSNGYLDWVKLAAASQGLTKVDIQDIADEFRDEARLENTPSTILQERLLGLIVDLKIKRSAK
jgi:hypothetical protein